MHRAYKWNLPREKFVVPCGRAARHKYGLLEKKGDYLKRARHHQKQENVLQVPHIAC